MKKHKNLILPALRAPLVMLALLLNSAYIWLSLLGDHPVMVVNAKMKTCPNPTAVPSTCTESDDTEIEPSSMASGITLTSTAPASYMGCYED